MSETYFDHQQEDEGGVYSLNKERQTYWKTKEGMLKKEDEIVPKSDRTKRTRKKDFRTDGRKKNETI